MIIHVSYASLQIESINYWGKQSSISNSRSCLHGRVQWCVLSSYILLNKFKDYVDKCLAMIDMNCKEVERVFKVCLCMRVSVCVCVYIFICKCTQACVSDINECIQKMDLNHWGRQIEELVSLSKAYRSRGEKQRHSSSPLQPPPPSRNNN